MKKFEELTNKISDLLISHGFKKSGQYYQYNPKDSDNIAIINLQKSRDSSSSNIIFTFNIGIHFKNIFYLNTGEVIKKPIINDCQWKIRIGKLMPINKDYWWNIDNSTDLEQITNELINIFQKFVFGEINDRISDKLYIEKLINESDSFEKVQNLSSLLCIYNDDRLDKVLEDLKVYCLNNRLADFYQNKIKQIDSWRQKPDGASIWEFIDDSYKWK